MNFLLLAYCYFAFLLRLNHTGVVVSQYAYKGTLYLDMRGRLEENRFGV